MNGLMCLRAPIASGLSGGVRRQLIPLSSEMALAIIEVCLGSFSWMNWWSGSVLQRKGISVLSRILQYKSASIMLSKMQILVVASLLMLAQT